MERRPQRSLGFAGAFRQEDGSTAIEFAIVAMALILTCLGTLEFGRALQVRNQLSHAADIAVREILTDADVPASDVEERIRTVIDAPNPALLTVDVDPPPGTLINGTRFRTISVTYPLVLLIPQLTHRSIVLSVEQRVPMT